MKIKPFIRMALQNIAQLCHVSYVNNGSIASILQTEIITVTTPALLASFTTSQVTEETVPA